MQESRPLNSHGFTVYHTVSLLFSRSHSSFFISHSFTNFQWVFFKLRKQAKAVQFLVKKYRSMVLFVILDIETTTRGCPGVAVPGDYQKQYEKYPLSINLASKLLFHGQFLQSFANFLERLLKTPMCNGKFVTLILIITV